MGKFVVHCKREKYDVYIGRPSKWGNPIALKKEEDREEVLIQYTEYLLTKPQLIEDAKFELREKVLGCWCSPRLCHGDILSLVANDDNFSLEDFLQKLKGSRKI